MRKSRTLMLLAMLGICGFVSRASAEEIVFQGINEMAKSAINADVWVENPPPSASIFRLHSAEGMIPITVDGVPEQAYCLESRTGCPVGA